jgi:hypothetical protein
VWLGCKNLAESGAGFTLGSLVSGRTIPEAFAASVSLRGLPAVVYVSGGVNDALVGTDASAEIIAFHDQLAALGVEQIWGTAPYTIGGTARLDRANNLVAAMNGAETWAKDCSGSNPNPNTIDGVHPTNADSLRFANCIAS